MNSLSKEQLEVISKAVIKEHKRAIQRESDEKRDWRLRNTSLLLKNYRMLRSHCDGIIEDLEIYEVMTYDPHELDLHELIKYKAKTARMLNYFDEMLENYKRYCDKSSEAVTRRFGVINYLYISDPSMSKADVGSRLNVDESTIRRDKKKAIEELSLYLFGIDSLNDFSNA